MNPKHIKTGGAFWKRKFAFIFGSCYVHPANNEVTKMPFLKKHIHVRKNLFPESFRKTFFPKTFQKNLLSEEELVFPEVLSNSFQKNVIRNVSGRSFFRKISFYFRKKGLSEIYFFKKMIL